MARSTSTSNAVRGPATAQHIAMCPVPLRPELRRGASRTSGCSRCVTSCRKPLHGEFLCYEGEDSAKTHSTDQRAPNGSRWFFHYPQKRRPFTRVAFSYNRPQCCPGDCRMHQHEPQRAGERRWRGALAVLAICALALSFTTRLWI